MDYITVAEASENGVFQKDAYKNCAKKIALTVL